MSKDDAVTIEQLRDTAACTTAVDILENAMKKRGWRRIRPTAVNLRWCETLGIDAEWPIAEGLVPREVALCEPRWAYQYAVFVDAGPSEDTRNAVLSDPAFAYLYAKVVDAGPRDDTRDAVQDNPHWADRYARFVENGVAYLSSYCNCQHNLRTGKPINHMCMVIPPAALQAEREDRHEAAVELIAEALKKQRLSRR